MTATMPQSQSNTHETPVQLREWSAPRAVPLPGGRESAGVPSVEAEIRRALYGLHDAVALPVMAANEKARRADDLNDQGRLRIVRAAMDSVMPVVEAARGVGERAAEQVRTWSMQLLAKVAGGPNAPEIRSRWPRKPEDQVVRVALLVQQVRDGTPDRAKAITILAAVHPSFDPAAVAGDGALLPSGYAKIVESIVLEAADNEMFENRERLALLVHLLDSEIASAEGFLKKVGNADLRGLQEIEREGRARRRSSARCAAKHTNAAGPAPDPGGVPRGGCMTKFAPSSSTPVAHGVAEADHLV